jgi:uncharacterized protein
MRSKVAGFEWNKGNWPKCGKHGVSKAEIEDVLSGKPLVLSDRYSQDVEARFNAVGKNKDGRHIFVVFTLRESDGQKLIRPISARYMHAKEIENYERQKGKQA